MNDQSLWDLFVRTGLPEAYSLYHRTTNGPARNPFGLPYRDSLTMNLDLNHSPEDKIRGA